MSISMSTLAFGVVSCLLLAGACLFSHCLHLWHQGFQINFLKMLIMALTSFAAACLVSFKTSCLVVQDVGTRPWMREAWCVGSGWKNVLPIGSRSRLWSSCACKFMRMIVKLIFVRTQVN